MSSSTTNTTSYISFAELVKTVKDKIKEVEHQPCRNEPRNIVICSESADRNQQIITKLKLSAMLPRSKYLHLDIGNYKEVYAYDQDTYLKFQSIISDFNAEELAKDEGLLRRTIILIYVKSKKEFQIIRK